MKTAERLALAFARGVVRGFARRANNPEVNAIANDLIAELTPKKSRLRPAGKPATGKTGAA